MASKIGVTPRQKTVAELDRWIRAGRYPNRSRALRLARELAKLNPSAEKRMADEGLIELTR